jgi:hypothetical protein
LCFVFWVGPDVLSPKQFRSVGKNSLSFFWQRREEVQVPDDMVDWVVQLDIKSHELGILAAHPITPLVSLHHLDFIPEIFPKTTTKTFTKVEAVKYLLDAATVDPGSILQRSICYDRKAGVVNSCFLGLCC